MGMEKIVLDTNVVTEDHHYDVLKWKDFPGLDIIGLDDFLAHLKNNPNL